MQISALFPVMHFFVGMSVRHSLYVIKRCPVLLLQALSWVLPMSVYNTKIAIVTNCRQHSLQSCIAISLPSTIIH